MSYTEILPSLDYVPVVTSYTCGSSLGAIKAVTGLVTSMGTVNGFDANGRLICTGNSLANVTSGVYYGFQLEATKTNAQAKGWPNNASDYVWTGHMPSGYIYSV